MYKLYSFLIATPLFLIFTIIIGLLVSVSALLGFKSLPHRYFPMWWGRVCCWLYLLPVHVEGREQLDPHQSYIFVANHQGYLDILLMYGFLGHSFKWMMKEYLKKMPVVGQACIISRQIFVGDSLTSIQQAVKRARTTLQGGMSMSIFPEGTRTYDGKMILFKRGAFMLANEIGLPIVPITINGSYQVMSRTMFHVDPGTITLTIHEPIPPEEFGTIQEITQKTYDSIVSSLDNP